MSKVPAAKTLLLWDTRKAQAIADFVKSMFMRDLVPIEDLSTQNCLYEAWLEQISNSDFMYYPDTGDQYSHLDLRTQLLHNMAVNYEAYYPQVVMHLECPYKEWFLKQMNQDTPSDLVAVSGGICSRYIVLNISVHFTSSRSQEEQVPISMSDLIPASIPI